MSFLGSLIDLLRRLIQLLTSIFNGPKTSSPGDEDLWRQLYINYAIVIPEPCTREQAMAFYSTLDGFQQLIDNLKATEDMDAYESWFESLNLWMQTNWAQFIDDSRDGTVFLMFGLGALIHHFALERLTGQVEQIPAYGVLDQARSMAEIDLTAMKNNRAPDIALEINRAVEDLPLCCGERATQFHKTIDGIQLMAKAMLQTDWGPSLKEWLQSFHAWRQEAWGTFYERPCGVVLLRMYEMESKIYLAALMHVSGIEQADQASGFSKAIEEWWSAAIKDKTRLMDTATRS